MTEPALSPDHVVEPAPSLDQTTTVSQYLAPLRDHRKVVLLVTLVTLALGVLLALAGPKSYTSTTSVLIYPVSADPTEALQATDRSDDMATELRIAESRAVAEVTAAELQDLGIEVTARAAATNITVTNPEDSRILNVSYQSSDPAVARVGSELATSTYLAYRSELNAASRQVARSAINDEIAVLQDRLTDVENRLEQTAAGSSARLIVEVQRTSIQGELEAQQGALADLSVLAIDAATVFDAAEEPISTDGLSVAQILVGALAGGLVLGVIAAWVLATLGLELPTTMAERSTRRLRRPAEQDDEPTDADSPFDDSDKRDPLELLKALDAVEADPLIGAETPAPTTDQPETPEPVDATAETGDHDAPFAEAYPNDLPQGDAPAGELIDGLLASQAEQQDMGQAEHQHDEIEPVEEAAAEAPTALQGLAELEAVPGPAELPPLDTPTTAAIPVEAVADEPADAVEEPFEVEAEVEEPFEVEAEAAFAPPTEAPIETEAPADTAADEADAPPTETSVEAETPVEAFAPPTEAPVEAGADDPFAVEAPTVDHQPVEAEPFDVGPFEAQPFEVEPTEPGAVEPTADDPFASEPFVPEPIAEAFVSEPIAEAVESTTSIDDHGDDDAGWEEVGAADVDSGDTQEASLSTGDPAELDPGPPSWDGPFIGPTTWEQLSAMAAESADAGFAGNGSAQEAAPTAVEPAHPEVDQVAPSEAIVDQGTAHEAIVDEGIVDEVPAEEMTPPDQPTPQAEAPAPQADVPAPPAEAPSPGAGRLVAGNDVDVLFEQLSRLGSAGPVAVLSLSDRTPAAGLTAGFELADELRAVGANVLLIDARIDAPVLDTLFEGGPGHGLAQVMTGQVVLGEAVRSLSGLDGLDLLTAGTIDDETASHLTGAAFHRLLAEAKLNYHSIVVIGGSVTAAGQDVATDVARAGALSVAVDALIVGTADPVGTVASDELAAVLDSFGAPTLQLITAPVTQADEAVPEASSV